MGKYAVSKSSIILYHKQTDLSIGFTKILEKYFSDCLGLMKKSKEQPLSRRVNHALIAATLCSVSCVISWIFFRAFDSRR